MILRNLDKSMIGYIYDSIFSMLRNSIVNLARIHLLLSKCLGYLSLATRIDNQRRTVNIFTFHSVKYSCIFTNALTHASPATTIRRSLKSTSFFGSGKHASAKNKFFGRSSPSLNLMSYVNNSSANTTLLSLLAKNLPGHANLPCPNVILLRPVVTN